MTGTSGGPDGSFDDRLRAARDKQRLDAVETGGASPPTGLGKPGGGRNPGGSPWGVGVRVGVDLVAALGVGVAIGLGLDRWLGTRPIMLALFVVLGGAAGVLNVWRMFAPRG